MDETKKGEEKENIENASDTLASYSKVLNSKSNEKENIDSARKIDKTEKPETEGTTDENNNKESEGDSYENKVNAFDEKSRGDKKHIRLIAGIIVIAAIAISLILYGIFRTYTDYEDSKVVDITSESGTTYAEFQGSLIKYSRDGVSCTDFDGNVLWSDSFEMDSPCVSSYGEYFMIYDKGGSLIEIMKKSGKVEKLTTTEPIVEADIASKGTTAVLMTGQDGSSISLYDISGNVLASGRLHISNTGYPVSLAISGNGENLAVSLIDIKDGKLKSTVEFFNFSSAGQNEKNNIMATFSYSDMVIPRVDYIAGTRPVAFGDSEIVVYSMANKPNVSKEIFPKGNIKSILLNDKYFGVVLTHAEVENTEKIKDDLILYSSGGRELFSKKISDNYLDIRLLSNNHVYLTDGNTISLYNVFGVKKFKYKFENGISAVMPWDGSSNYIFIENGKLHKVKLK